jgi:hypothetical protein
VLTYEELEDIWVWLRTSPRKSLRHLSQERGVSVGSFFKATKLVKFHPYKVRVVHELKTVDVPKAFRFVTRC